MIHLLSSINFIVTPTFAFIPGASSFSYDGIDHLRDKRMMRIFGGALSYGCKMIVGYTTKYSRQNAKFSCLAISYSLTGISTYLDSHIDHSGFNEIRRGNNKYLLNFVCHMKIGV